jgi:hypothetical protein
MYRSNVNHMCNIARSAEFFRFQNCKKKTAQEITKIKKAGRTNHCNDLNFKVQRRNLEVRTDRNNNNFIFSKDSSKSNAYPKSIS